MTLAFPHVQRITKKHAEAYYAMQEKGPVSPGKNKAECLIGEMDGAMIPVVTFEENEHRDKRKRRKAAWKEARLSVARKHKSFDRIFLATLGSTERVGNLLGRCAERLGYDENTKIHCLGDGAFWIQEESRESIWDAGGYLIDFFHLSEYLAKAVEECDVQQAKRWLKERQTEIKADQSKKVMRLLKNNERVAEKESVSKCIRYIENRPGQFKYKEALAKELPIGPGEVESGNRSVVQKRLKISGAWWKPQTAEHMLALRCMRMNGDWERYWNLINPRFPNAA